MSDYLILGAPCCGKAVSVSPWASVGVPMRCPACLAQFTFTKTHQLELYVPRLPKTVGLRLLEWLLGR